MKRSTRNWLIFGAAAALMIYLVSKATAKPAAAGTAGKDTSFSSSGGDF